jgi:hypothetical protein
MGRGMWRASLFVVLAAGCSAGKPCASDADCPTHAVCAVDRAAAQAGEGRRCLATCATDADCLLVGGFGAKCRPLQDAALGPATIELRDRIAGHRANVDRTTRGAIRVCRNDEQAVQ